MFLKQLVEDFTFDDVLEFYSYNKYFSYIRKNYSLTEEDALYFELLLRSDAPCNKFSLEVLTIEKNGLLPEVRFVDHEDESTPLKDRDIKFEDYVGCPVDMNWTENDSRGLTLITLLLLHQTYYKQLDDKSLRNRDLSAIGGIEMVGTMVLDDLVKQDEIRQSELINRNKRGKGYGVE